MDDIFISYAREDRPRVLALAQALEARGFSLWIDHEIRPGSDFDDAIEKALDATRCVVVVWTTDSVKSRWVRTEASAALERNRLVPVLLDQVPIPLEFRRVEAADLTQWHAGESSPEFDRLVLAVNSLTGRRDDPPVPPPPTSGGMRRLAIGGGALLAAGLAAWLMLHRSAGDTPSPPSAPTPAAPAATQAPETPPAVATVRQSTAPAPSKGDALPAAPEPAIATVAPAGAAGIEAGIAITIGDRIDEDVPAAGAGVIATAYAETVYWFDAAAREPVFFRVRGYDAGLSNIRWKLTDSTGRDLFDSCLGCSQPGVVELRQGGRYRLTVGGGAADTGRYSLRLTRVPAPDRIAVTLPITIREGVPEPGAGLIEAPGARDLYVFSTAPRTRVGVYGGTHSDGMSGLRWRLLDSEGESVFDSCLGCSDPGVHELRTGGEYTLAVGGNADPATGSYTALIVSVPPPTRFDVGTLDGVVRVAPGVPAAGAGEIESPGAVDVFAFNVPAQSRVAVRIVNASQGMSGIRLSITDADGNSLHDSCLGCSDPGALDLRQAGTYSVAVGSGTDPAVGTYALEIGRIK